VKVASPQESVFVASASFASPPGAAAKAAARGWPLIDDTPLADPSSLITDLAPDDPIRIFVQHWLRDEGESPATTMTGVSQQLDRAIEKSSARWQTLYEMGRVSAFLDDPPGQEAFWRAAVHRAELKSGNSPVAQREVRSMEILAGAFLLRWHDYNTAQLAFRILLGWRMSRPALQAAQAR
jgi:hypothetical protein